MKALELLQKYPKVADTIGEFYHSKLVSSMHDDDTIPEEFKELVKSQEFDNEYIAKFIDENPRFLFDVFDMNNIYIQTPIHWDQGEAFFGYTIQRPEEPEFVSINRYNYRDIAEKFAVEKAFEYLNSQL
jgi:hypothetical protein